MPVVRNLSGVCEAGAGVADEECCHQYVEQVSFSFAQRAGLDVVE